MFVTICSSLDIAYWASFIYLFNLLSMFCALHFHRQYAIYSLCDFPKVIIFIEVFFNIYDAYVAVA